MDEDDRFLIRSNTSKKTDQSVKVLKKKINLEFSTQQKYLTKTNKQKSGFEREKGREIDVLRKTWKNWSPTDLNYRKNKVRKDIHTGEK